MAFDPGDRAAASALDDILSGPAAALTAVALIAGPQARASGWAARAAAALAAGWQGTRRVVLVDLDLVLPAVHEHAGVPNEEGIADVIEYGLSLSMVCQAAAAGDYDVVSAGLYVPEPAAVLRSESWTRILLEVAGRRGTLLALVPADAEGADAIVRRVGAVLVLAEEAEQKAVVERLPSAYSVLAIVSPPVQVIETGPASSADADHRADEEEDEPLVIAAAASALFDEPPGSFAHDVQGQEEAEHTDDAHATPALKPADVSASATSPRLPDDEFDRIRLPTDRESRESLIADLRHRQRNARMGAVATADTGAARSSTGAEHAVVLLPASGSARERDLRVETMGDDVELETLDPGAPAEPVEPWRYRRHLAWTVAVVLAVSLLAGAWRFLNGRIGMINRQPAPAAEAPPVAEPVIEPTEPAELALPFVVAMEAHTDLATALRRLDALEQEEGLSFHIAPLEREGTLYYHVMGGPVADSATAVALRDTLLARRLKTAATPTDVRHAPLSFLVGEYSERGAAEDAISELRRLDVPSFMHGATAADGAPIFRVFVGAFTAPAEADVTRQLLRAAGVRDSLVTRMGSITS